MSTDTFYRKYRSKTFGELVGQTAIIQTLQNAIAHHRIGHAYIFSGPRGTGKTSTARIFAKTLNCLNTNSPLDTVSCGESNTTCVCRKIASGYSVDVIEIDAASNTGVDHIRQLNEQVQFAPVECQYKLIIIDEVHMLSTGAFNALLKTLEEPPANTIFILATTEPHKIPATIHSRCQTLYFRKLTLQELVSQLRFISDQESITISDASLMMIARNASGCMRDAISLLNQVFSFRGHTISQEDVMMILGAISQDQLVRFLQAIFDQDAGETASILHAFFLNGVNVSQLIGDVLFLLKQCVYLSMKADALVDLDASIQNLLSPILNVATTRDLTAWLELFAKLETELRWFSDPELLFEARVLTALHDVGAPGTAGTAASTSSSASSAPPVSATRPVMSVPSTFPPGKASDVSRSSSLSHLSQQNGSGKNGGTSSQTVLPASGAVSIVSGANQGASAPDFAERRASWTTFLDKIKIENPAVYGILENSVAQGITSSVVYIRLKQSFRFFIEKLKEEPNRKLIESVLQTVFGRALRYHLLEEGESVPSSAPPADPKQTNASFGTSASEAANTHSAVGGSPPKAESVTRIDSTPARQLNQIISMFDGQVV